MSPAGRVYEVSKEAQRRLNVGASLQKLSREMGAAGFKVGYTTIWRWEVGKGVPNAVHRAAWDAALTRLENDIRKRLKDLLEDIGGR